LAGVLKQLRVIRPVAAVFRLFRRLTLRRRATSRRWNAFWKSKTLEAMSPVEWESLVRRLRQMLPVEARDEDTARSTGPASAAGCSTPIAPLLGLCQPAGARSRLRRADAAECAHISWLPTTCAYRLLPRAATSIGGPAVSGSAETVHEAGISMRGRVAASETDLSEPEDYSNTCSTRSLEARVGAARSPATALPDWEPERRFSRLGLVRGRPWMVANSDNSCSRHMNRA